MERRLEALKGLGQTHHGMGHEPEAGEYFRQAISAAKEIGLALREIARLYWWLGDLLWWRNKYEEMYRLGEEGLALLGEATQSVEAALMNALVATGYSFIGNSEKYREFTSRNARFIARLPYSEELRPPHNHIVRMYAYRLKQIEEAARWLEIFQRKAEEHHDLRALTEVHQLTAEFLRARGDLRGSISRDEQALELYLKIGDEKHLALAAGALASAYLALGEMGRAKEYAERALAITEGVGPNWDTAATCVELGTAWLVQHAPERAITAFQRAVGLARDVGNHVAEAQAIYSLGRAYLAQGDHRAALQRFQEALTRVLPGAAAGAASLPYTFAAVLSGLEEAHDDPEEFRALCRRYREERPEVAPSRFVQWYLEPAQPDFGFWILDFGLGRERAVGSRPPAIGVRTDGRGPTADSPALPQSKIQNPKSKIQNEGWSWHDPFGDCSLTVENGLEIHAANGRDLWQINLSAPRLLRAAAADFAIQTACLPAMDEKPAIGGLLLWKDRENFLRLERGTKGQHEVTFEGCLAGEQCQFGRGRLVADRLFLRLERRGPRVAAFCSADGEEWFTAGQAEFPVEDPVEAGLHALGAINRLIHPGAYPEGTAIRFESFQLWAFS